MKGAFEMYTDLRELIQANTLLYLWEGMSEKELFKLVLKQRLPCFKKPFNPCLSSKSFHLREFSIREETMQGTFRKIVPASIEEFLNKRDCCYFFLSDTELYEKAYPEVLNLKASVPPYLDGSNEYFAPELALAIRLWESIANGEFDAKKENLSTFVETYLNKELPGMEIPQVMKNRFATMVSDKPDSLKKSGIVEIIKKKFLPHVEKKLPHVET